MRTGVSAGGQGGRVRGCRRCDVLVTCAGVRGWLLRRAGNVCRRARMGISVSKVPRVTSKW
nr:MAG TPA: hypothetical protein [Caudoviricetes sp.]